ATALTVAEGTRVVLSMVPNGVGLTITLPNGSTVGDNHSLGRVDVSDSGTYLLTTDGGCQTTLDLTVGDQVTNTLESSKEIVSSDYTKNNVENDILVFPNPTTGILQLNLVNYMGYSLRVNVFNSSQQNVMVHEFDADHDANEILVFGDHMADGLYRIVIEGPRGTIVQSVILSR
ncbi:T9SS type A sorting domain-containing protein, partial [Kriegella aquimaris]